VRLGSRRDPSLGRVSDGVKTAKVIDPSPESCVPTTKCEDPALWSGGREGGEASGLRPQLRARQSDPCSALLLW
jgi:hypothetical protein